MTSDEIKRENKEARQTAEEGTAEPTRDGAREISMMSPHKGSTLSSSQRSVQPQVARHRAHVTFPFRTHQP